MKASLLSLALTGASFANAYSDMFHYNRPGVINGPSMWIFGGNGLDVYSPDGNNKFKHTPAAEVCHNTTGYRGEWALSCSFYDVVSDGKKYVWGAVSRGVPKIDVFDIDTGSSVGSFETCGGPRGMEYHPLRDEIWVRCSGTNSEDESDDSETYIDVFAAGSPGVDTTANVMLTDNSTLSAYGQSVVDMSLEDVGYSTVWNQNKLYKVDLSSKKVISQFTVPLAYGMNEVAYSKMNQHIFIRASVCCTCGYVGADNEDCGRYGSDDVTLTTGPFAGQVKQGQCGRCDGAVGVDTLGVYEFDTATEKFVGSHVMADGTGGDPFPSPDGKWIVLVGYNGGEKLRILKSGSNGVSSSVAFDLELGFSSSGAEKSPVFNDFAFIQGDGRDMIIVASGTENKVAMIDMSGGSPRISKVTISSNSATTADDRFRRQVEHVRGTPYVWIAGHKTDEVYVVNIDSKRLVNTLTGVKSTKMLHVENYERKQTLELIQNMIGNGGSVSSDGSGSGSGTGTGTGSGTSSNGVSNSYKSVSSDESKVDPVGIVGLVVGLVACVLGVANMIFMKKATAALQKSGGDNFDDDDGKKSLGSSKIPV